MSSKWIKPYRQSSTTVMAAVLGAVCAFMLAGGIVGGVYTWVVAGWGSAQGVLPFCLIVAGLEIIVWRVHREALLNNDSGVRIRRVFSTCTVTWSRVRAIRTVAMDLSGDQQIVLELDNGTDLPAPVVCWNDRWPRWAIRGEVGAAPLSHEEFRSLVERLERGVANAVTMNVDGVG